MADNHLIRKEMKVKRNLLSKEEIDAKSTEVTSNLLKFCKDLEARAFLCYYPSGSEVNLLHFYQTLLNKNFMLYFPVSNIAEHTLSFYQVYDLYQDFNQGAYHIMEPKALADRKLIDFDNDIICITPGLVFDDACNRIGYGGGFYDRFFAAHSELFKVAVSYDFQIIDTIIPDKYDVALDAVVCQSKIIKRK